MASKFEIEVIPVNKFIFRWFLYHQLKKAYNLVIVSIIIKRV